jgi:hypothetical protein
MRPSSYAALRRRAAPATPTIQDPIGGIEVINRHPEGTPIGRYRHVPVEVHGADPAAASPPSLAPANAPVVHCSPQTITGRA